MGNMSYCRFENTEKDLTDCLYAIEEEEYTDLSSYHEERALRDLFDTCEAILDYKEEVLEKLNNKY
tara:strand:+ start:453 stop:650 length:198 start_codon:yes stop_codon:yes gene_type:complete